MSVPRKRRSRVDRVKDLQRTVGPVLDDKPAGDDPVAPSGRKDTGLEDAVRDHHHTLRRSGLRPS